MNAELRDCQGQFESLKADATKPTSGLSDEQFNWQPSPKRWSVGQCLEHLNIFGKGTVVPALDELIANAEKRKLYSDGPFRHGRLGNWIIRFLDAPADKRIRTAKSFIPPAELSKAKVMETFLTLQDDFIERLEHADGLNLAAVKKRLPMPVWLNLGQWFAFAAAHERRHLRQAKQVVTETNFPNRTAQEVA